jgi:hypothetical protein
MTYRVVTTDRLDEHPDAFAQIQDGGLDGIVLKQAFPAELMDRVATGTLDLLDRADPLTFGAMLGHPLNKWTGDQADYLDQAEAFVDVHRQLFGYDLRAHLNALFAPATGGRAVDVPVEEGRPYTPATFRVMHPGHGGLKAHTGNEFVELQRDRGMRWLMPRARMLDCMSWFAVAQPAEEGGELRLADLLWSDTDEALKGFDRNNRDDAFFDELGTEAVPLAAGDLIVFAGGRIWHKVDDLGGTRDRVTFGGFMAVTFADDEIWYWS